MFLDAYNFTSLFLTFHHCVKYQNFTKFPGVGLWLKRTVFAEFWAFCPETLRKLCVSTKFPPGNLVTFRYFTQCVSTTGLLFCLNNLKGVTKLYVACSSLKGVTKLYVACSSLKGVTKLYVACSSLKGVTKLCVACSSLGNSFLYQTFTLALLIAT